MSPKSALPKPRVSESMFEAIVSNDVVEIERLIDGGESLSATYKNTRLTPLLLAADGAAPEVLELLIRRGADLAARDPLGNAALARAAESNRPVLVALFLRHGLPIDDQDSYGNTALHRAVIADGAEAAQFLLQNGASPSLPNRSGITPRDLVEGDPKGRLKAVFGIT